MSIVPNLFKSSGGQSPQTVISPLQVSTSTADASQGFRRLLKRRRGRAATLLAGESSDRANIQELVRNTLLGGGP